MAASTIAGHLALFVRTGELPISDFVSEEKAKLITGFFKENPETSLGESKKALGEEISYNDLKFVKQHLLFNSKKAKSE
jgi:hypothetical protein